MNQILCFSGGKDSTAMLLMMIEQNEPIHSVVWFDTGWEFPQMHDHIKQVEEYTGIEIVKLKPKKSFNYWMFEHNGKGWGFPNIGVRWCTSIKRDTIRKYCNQFKPFVINIGFAYDEQHRMKPQNHRGQQYRYPLVEFKKSESACLQYCWQKGFTFGGLYQIFNRVSCWCCPFSSLNELRALRKYFPDLWNKLLEMQKKSFWRFRPKETVDDLELRFKTEDKQLKLF